MTIPETYNHKATSESFNGDTKVAIYYSDTHGDYLLEIDDGKDTQGWYFTEAQLRLVVHAGTDVLDNLSV